MSGLKPLKMSRINMLVCNNKAKLLHPLASETEFHRGWSDLLMSCTDFITSLFLHRFGTTVLPGTNEA